MDRKPWIFLFVASLLFLVSVSVLFREAHKPWRTYRRQALESGSPEGETNLAGGGLRIREIYLPQWGVRERCLTCHEGIEEISPSHPVESFGCTICHGGDGLGVTVEDAHRGLIGGRNPSDLRVVDRTCGRRAPDGTACHEGRALRWQNQVERVKRTLMATMAGVIAGLRFTWRAQETPVARYASVGVLDLDADVPVGQGAVPSLETIPVYRLRDYLTGSQPLDPLGRPLKESGEVADDQWRKFCARCHLWNRRPMGPSGHSGGCASCHSPHNDTSTYEGGDPTIPRGKPGYAAVHRITIRIPTSQCARCHNRSGRIGLSYQGLMESDRYGTPYQGGDFNRHRLNAGRFVLHLVPDIHFEKGMHCIDCHTAWDTMGDGNIYSRMRYQVEIRCRNCHGTFREPPEERAVQGDGGYASWASRLFGGWPLQNGDRTALSRRGRPLINVVKRPAGWVLYGKVDGKAHSIPIITGKPGPHGMPGHGRLSCTACHTAWAPQCYGCHDYRLRGQKQMDSNTNLLVKGRWRETRGYYRFEDPPLGLDEEGRVTPYMPGCQVIFSELDEDGKTVPPWDRYVFRGGGLLNGIVSVPIHPHTIRREVRPCVSCHMDPKILGLGEGFLHKGDVPGKMGFLPLHDPQAEGLPVDFALESLVTPDGLPLQGTSHPGARPFNRGEIVRILRVGTCLPCHDRYEDPIYGDWQRSLSRDLSEEHRRAVLRSLKAAGEIRGRYGGP